ncbi:hypothetical protein RAK27_19475 [Carnobacterium maltaromaticum]|uniref:Uncharacterized protein n=1 Tax=Carnobacterium maltaromaticum TaxID=2751 RepID=A0AAW9K9K7_CARML|nr:hypothetical protein [Carnobacterium maltaromaticum]
MSEPIFLVRTYTLTKSTVLKAKKSRVDSSLCQFFYELFSFCEQSIMSPCCEFLVVDCFQFLSIGRENFFQLLVLGDWGTPKKLLTTNFFLKLVVDKNWSHASMLLCSQKEKMTVCNSLFLFLYVSVFPEGMKIDHTIFF